MILNWKCKEMFLEWYNEPETYFYRLNKICQNALIIEFFDSVGIYIEIHYSRILGDKFFCIVNTEAKHNLTSYQDSRQEATEQAIIKANEIYNVRYSKQKQVK